MTNESNLLVHRYKPVPNKGLRLIVSSSSRVTFKRNTDAGSGDIEVSRSLVLICQFWIEESQRCERVRQVDRAIDGHVGAAKRGRGGVLLPVLLGHYFYGPE
jgi:hypothetical protein